MAIVDHDLPKNPDDYQALEFVAEAELLRTEALEALVPEPDEAMATAHARLDELNALQKKISVALVEAEQASEAAQAALQDVLGARLQGQPRDDEDAIKANAISCELEMRALITYHATVGEQLKEAERALAEVVLQRKLDVARQRWNALATESYETAKRMSKSLRELRSWFDKLQALAQEQEPYGVILGRGNTTTWAFARRRLLETYIKSALWGMIDVEYLSGGKREIVEQRLCDRWPFAQRVATQEAPAAEGEVS